MTRGNSEKIRVLLTRSRTFTTIRKKSGKLGNNPSAPNKEANLYDFSNISRENSVKIRLRKSRTHGLPITGSDALPLRSGISRGSKTYVWQLFCIATLANISLCLWYVVTYNDYWVFLFLLFVRAMSSPSNKEQFLNQFESIVKGIVDNKDRVSFAVIFTAYWWTQ